MKTNRVYKMRELCEITSSKRIYAADYKPDGVPFYRGKEISEKFKGNLDVSTELFIDRDKFEQIRHRFGAPIGGDLLLTSVGTLGSPYVVNNGEEFYFKDGNLTWFRKFNHLESQFLYYWLQSSQGKAELKKCTIGSSQSAYTIVLLKEMEITLPPLPVQRKIAAILSAYDDLIENNLRRIKILEEMAQNLYREWFVKFRFPGHDQTRFVDSPLGRVPEGWEVRKITELLKKVKRGLKIQKKDYAEKGFIPIVDQGREFLGGYTEDIESLNSGELPLIIFGDHTRILKFIDFPFACGADGTQLLKSNNERMPMALFYYTLLSIDLSDFAYARHFKFLKEKPIILPSLEISMSFEDFVLPLREQIRSLMQRNANLRRTRDMLLPKLISGAVDVSDLDIPIPEEAVA